jgi:hypothetical protein
VQKRKLNELTNDEDKPAEAAGQEDQECANSKKYREEGNDMDLEVCTYLELETKIIHSIAHKNGSNAVYGSDQRPRILLVGLDP